MVRMVENCSKAMMVATHHYIMNTSNHSYTTLMLCTSYSISYVLEMPPKVIES